MGALKNINAACDRLGFFIRTRLFASFLLAVALRFCFSTRLQLLIGLYRYRRISAIRSSSPCMSCLQHARVLKIVRARARNRRRNARARTPLINSG